VVRGGGRPPRAPRTNSAEGGEEGGRRRAPRAPRAPRAAPAEGAEEGADGAPAPRARNALNADGSKPAPVVRGGWRPPPTTGSARSGRRGRTRGDNAEGEDAAGEHTGSGLAPLGPSALPPDDAAEALPTHIDGLALDA
jgi:hypothetical protein